MNCCDEYGDCRQSDDCPIRTGVVLPHQAACAARRKQAEEEGVPLTKGEYREIALLSILACCVVAVLGYALWHLIDAILFMWELFA